MSFSVYQSPYKKRHLDATLSLQCLVDPKPANSQVCWTFFATWGYKKKPLPTFGQSHLAEFISYNRLLHKQVHYAFTCWQAQAIIKSAGEEETQFKSRRRLWDWIAIQLEFINYISVIHQSWALAVFFNFLNNKMDNFGIFYQVKFDWGWAF